MIDASIIITSHNYGAYVGRAIESALSQAHASCEVIVVDDGSCDDSPSIIRAFGDRVCAVFKANGGQASAMNAGFAAARGDVILFLDSDDELEPDAVGLAIAALRDPAVSKAHWPLRKIDARGCERGGLEPAALLSSGDLRDAVLRFGPRSDLNIWPPTSGNAWSRRFLSRVLPVPQDTYLTCPDLYLCALAPLYGQVVSIDRPLARWRVHAQNNTHREAFLPRLDRYVALWEATCEHLEGHARQLGLQPQPAHWLEQSWWHRLRDTARLLHRMLPPARPFVLIDDEQWGCGEIAGRSALQLIAGGGAPTDDEHAIRELEARRAEGARCIVVAKSARWWLEHYRDFADHVAKHFEQTADTPDVAVYTSRP